MMTQENTLVFLILASIPGIATIVYLFINYHLLKSELVSKKTSKGFYLATILPLFLVSAFYFFYES